jgi:hypothetical protein
MEDLRDNETIEKEDGVKKSIINHKINIFGNLSDLYMITLLIIKKYKFFFILSFLILFIIYPNEIGTFIGDIIYNFVEGLMKNFK